MEAVVAPMDMPFVVNADPISNKASVNDNPIVVKAIEKMASVDIKSNMATRAGRYS